MKNTTADGFNREWHESVDGTWHTMRWLGVKVLKTPTDLFMYQELICRIKPSLIIETGTCFGGSALYMATICDAIRRGRVLTIDIRQPRNAVHHPRVEFYTGGSTQPETLHHVRQQIKKHGGPVMVVLDSSHETAHVAKELELYSPFVTRDSYIIVEDTNMGRLIRPEQGPGPADAVDVFMRERRDFIVDTKCEKYYLTFNPGGYLRRVRKAE